MGAQVRPDEKEPCRMPAQSSPCNGSEPEVGEGDSPANVERRGLAPWFPSGGTARVPASDAKLPDVLSAPEKSAGMNPENPRATLALGCSELAKAARTLPFCCRCERFHTDRRPSDVKRNLARRSATAFLEPS